MILEYRLEEFLIENLDLIEKNISLLYHQKTFRGEGRPDICCKDNKGNLFVIELKVHALLDAIEQIKGYQKIFYTRGYKQHQIKLYIACLSCSRTLKKKCKEEKINLRIIKDKRLDSIEEKYKKLPFLHKRILETYLNSRYSEQPAFVAHRVGHPEKKVKKIMKELTYKYGFKFKESLTPIGKIRVYKLKI